MLSAQLPIVTLDRLPSLRRCGMRPTPATPNDALQRTTQTRPGTGVFRPPYISEESLGNHNISYGETARDVENAGYTRAIGFGCIFLYRSVRSLSLLAVLQTRCPLLLPPLCIYMCRVNDIVTYINAISYILLVFSEDPTTVHHHPRPMFT